MGKHSRLKKLAKHLLATTCLTAGVTGMASAQTVNETTDFGNTFATASLLPAGTRTVNGALTTNTDGAPDTNDYIEFSGLLGGSSFSFTDSTPGDHSTLMDVVVVNSSDLGLPGSPFAFATVPVESARASGSGTVPLDGILVFDTQIKSGSFSTSYQLNLTATDAAAGAPEPGTIGATGLGLAALAGFARRRKKNQTR